MAKTIIKGSVTLSSKKCNVTVSSIAPLNPTEYTLWIDTTDNNALKRWENGKWVTINDNKIVIDYFHEVLEDNYYTRTATDSLVQQTVGSTKIDIEGIITDKYNELTEIISDNKSSITQRADSIETNVKSLQTTTTTNTKNINGLTDRVTIVENSTSSITQRADSIETNVRNLDNQLLFVKSDMNTVSATTGLCETRITQLSDKINLLVTGDGKTSSISLTPKFISLISENINFNGLVSFQNSVNSIIEDNDNIKKLNKITKTGTTIIDGDEITSSNPTENLYACLKGGSLELYDSNNSAITLNIKNGIRVTDSGYNAVIRIEEASLGYHYSSKYVMTSSYGLVVGEYSDGNTHVGCVIEDYKISLYSRGSAWLDDADADGNYMFYTRSVTQRENPAFEASEDGVYITVDTKLNNLVVTGATTLNDKLTANKPVTIKNNAKITGRLQVQNSIDFYDEQMTCSYNDGTLASAFFVKGMYCYNETTNYKHNVYYTVDGMTLYNKRGSAVGSFGYYKGSETDYDYSWLQTTYIDVTNSLEVGTTLTVKGATTLNNTLTVNNNAKITGRLWVQSTIDFYDEQMICKTSEGETDVYWRGMYCYNLKSGYKHTVKYTADGMTLYDKNGNSVGEFGYYNGSSNGYTISYVKTGYLTVNNTLTVTGETRLNSKLTVGNELYCCSSFHFLKDEAGSHRVSFLTNTSYPYLKMAQWSNWLSIYPATKNSAELGSGDYPFQQIYANNFYNSSGLITSSDKRVKKDIKDIDDDFANTLIDSISPKTYKYINGTSNRTHCGAIAQEVEEVITDMGLTTQDFGGIVKDYKIKEIEGEDEIPISEIDYESEPDYYLRYEEFIMPLVRYCQLLKKRIEVLENTLIKDEVCETTEKNEAEETGKIIET